MTRIAKADVHTALDRVGQNIKSAAGSDGTTSRADIQAKIKTLSGTEAQLTDRFFRFTDHRDHKAGARITGSDIDKALSYAKDKLVNAYDVNGNGLSKAEVEKMSLTGQLAVKLAGEIKGVAAPSPSEPAGPLAAAFAAAAKNTWYMSESDSQPQFISTKLPAGALTPASVFQAFNQELAQRFDEHTGNLSSYVAVDMSKDFLAEVGADYGSDNGKKNGFELLQQVVDANLTNVVGVRVGPRGSDGKIATDAGAYQLLVVGKTADNKLAGVIFESVET
jgi:hypothetical protein